MPVAKLDLAPQATAPCQDSILCLQQRHGIHLPSAKLLSGRGGPSLAPPLEFPEVEWTRMYRATIWRSRAANRRDSPDCRSEIRRRRGLSLPQPKGRFPLYGVWPLTT